MRTFTTTLFSIALAAAAFGCQRTDHTMTQPASMEQPPSAYGGGPSTPTSTADENASETDKSGGVDDPTAPPKSAPTKIESPTKIDNGLSAEDQAGPSAGSATTDAGKPQLSNPSLVPRDMSGAPPAGAPPYSPAPYSPMP